jgi:hypothetical protein
LINEIVAGEYYSKIEPVDSFYIKSSVSGQIVDVKEEYEGKNSDSTIIIHIDDKIDIMDLKSSRKKLLLLKSNISYLKRVLLIQKKV